MITLNRLIGQLYDKMVEDREVSPYGTSHKAMSIAISAKWRAMDGCKPGSPPLHLTRGFVEGEHRDDPCKTYTTEFGEREELSADIIIWTALAMRHLGCENIEQAIKDRIAWLMEHGDE